MTLISGSASADIPAPRERCWEVLADVAAWPRWQRGLERVDVVERDGDGRPTLCDVVMDAKVATVRCRTRIAYDAPGRLSFARVASEEVDEMEGSWELDALGDSGTRATFSLAVDPGPIPRMARPLVRAARPLVVDRRPGELARAVAGG